MACLDSSSSFEPPRPDAGSANMDSGLPASEGGIVNECPKPTAGPTAHQGGVQSETWTADTSPHTLAADVTVYGTLTLEPCTEVLIGGGKSISVGATGKVVAEGLANKPIHIGAIDPTKPFAQIRVGGGGTLRFAHTKLDHGGDPLNTIADLTGTIFAQGADQNQPTQATVSVAHVTIDGSKSNGINMIDGAGFAPGSEDLTVTGSAQFPVSLWGRAIGTLPSGKYTGNANDEILIPGGGGAQAIHEDATMRNRGVPYRVGNSNSGSNPTFVIERQSPSSPGLATLTIEPGVKVRVKKGGLIQVQRFVNPSPAQGALVVNGTAAQPVIFTSAEPNPQPGDWLGIWFGLIPAPTDKINYAIVEYAGGQSNSGSDACNTPGTNDAAIRILGLPSGSFITNTTIKDSAGHGIDRGWRNDSKPEFLNTNTFTNVARCNQSFPRDTSGACPSTVPCPK